MRIFLKLARSAVVPFLAGLFLNPSFVMAESDCQVPLITDSETLVSLALSCNGKQQAIGSRMQAQQYLTQAAGQLDDPKLTLGVAPQTFGEDRLDDGYIVELSQPLPWPGLLSLRENVSASKSNVLQARYNQDQINLAKHVRLAFAEMQFHSQLVSINQSHQALWLEFIDVVRVKYASGTASKSAVLQATHEYHQLMQEAIELKSSIDREVSKLKYLANLPVLTQFKMDSNLPLTHLPANTFKEILALLDRQPAMQGIKAKKQQKDNELALAEIDRYPKLSVMARYNSLWMNDEKRWVVGVGLNLPFDFGKRSNREDSLRSEQSALNWEQQDLRVQLREQLVQTHSLWQQAIEVYQLYQSDLLPLAQENLTTTLDEYQSGAGSFLSLLTAQRQLLATERKAEMVRRDQYAQFAQFTAASGLVRMSGWRESINSNSENNSFNQKENSHE